MIFSKIPKVKIISGVNNDDNLSCRNLLFTVIDSSFMVIDSLLTCQSAVLLIFTYFIDMVLITLYVDILITFRG